MDNKYTRVVIKISGEALAGENGFGLNNAVIAGVVEQIAKVRNMGIQIGIIIGGGNFWRGYGQNDCRPYGYARNRHQLACNAGRFGTRGRAYARYDGNRNAQSRRALHLTPCDPPP